MGNQAQRILICCILGACIGTVALADETRFSAASFSRGRALAMGGAYHSVSDDFSAVWYNPGALRVNKTRVERNARFFLNPVGMGLGFLDYSQYDRRMVPDDELTPEEGLLAVSHLFKGMVYTTPIVDFGLNLGEEILAENPGYSENHRFFSIREQTFGSMYSLAANLKLAPTVSLGISGTLYYSRAGSKITTGSGYTFGVLLNPNSRLNVGIVFHDIPDNMQEARFPLETIADGTVVGGISYYPDEDTVLSIDLRNLNKDKLRSSREIHTGIERTIAGRLALRAGYYRKKETEHDVLSFGVGILPMWDRVTKYRNSARSDMITYTVVVDQNGTRSTWHLFSFLLRY